MTISPRRRLLAAFGLVSALSLGVAGVAFGGSIHKTVADWPLLRGDLQRRGVSEEKVAPPLSLLWKYTAGPQQDNPCAPVIVGGTVYYATRSAVNGGGMVYALDTKTGARRWQFPGGEGLRDRNTFLTAPSLQGDNLYIGASDGYVYVLDMKTGQEVKKYRSARPVASSPTIINDVLMFGSNDGTFYALNPETNEPVWKNPYRPGDAVTSAPVLGEGLIFFTTSDNSVHAMRQATGIFRWKQRMPFRMVNNAPVYADNTLFVPSGPRLVAVQPVSGSIRWQRPLPNDILAAPVAEAGLIYVVNRDQRGTGAQMHAIRSQNGKDAWAEPVALPAVPSASPTLSGDVIYVPTNRNMVVAVSKTNGAILWTYSLEPAVSRPGLQPAATTAITSPVSISDGTVFVLSDDGSLSAFRSDAPDTTGPDVTIRYPFAGQAVSGQPPVTMAAIVKDVGSGLDPDSLQIKLDDKAYQAIYDPTRNLVLYATRSSGKIVDPPLPNGRHTVSVTAKDWRGNTTEQSWSFIVNNSLRPPTSREAPTTAGVRPGVGTPPAGSGTPPAGNRPGGRPRGGRGGRGGQGGRPGG